MVRKYLIPILIVALVVANIALLWDDYQARHRLAEGMARTPYLVEMDGQSHDFRGIFTYPGAGAYFTFMDTNGKRHRANMTLAVFMSANTSCPANLSELDIFRRMIPLLRERNQALVAVTAPGDSAVVARFLDSVALDVPLINGESEIGLTFAQMGLSKHAMPFKIIYDSTFTAVYMRGGDNTPESQASFEQAAMWLSEQFAGRKGT